MRHHRPASAIRYKRFSRDRWLDLIHTYQQSGLTQREFCHTHGLALSTFALWRRRLRGEPGPSTSPSFVAVTVDADQGTTAAQRHADRAVRVDADLPGLSVTLTSGLRIEGVDVTNLDAVVALVRAL